MRFARALTTVAALATALSPPTLLAQAPLDATQVLRITRSGEGPAAHAITLGQGKAAIVELPADARDVLLSEPEVADAIVRTARRIYLIGRKLGQSNVFIFDASGRQIAMLELRVEPDVGPLNEMIRRLAPDARVTVEAVNGAFVLTGSVRDSAEADRVVQLARRFAATAQGASVPGGDAQDPVVNLLTIEGRDQVLVKVRIVEMSRTLTKQLGVNLNVQNIVNQLVPSDTFVEVATQNGFSVAGAALGGLGAQFGRVDTILQPTDLTYGNLGALSGFNDQSFSQAGQLPPPGNAGVGGYSYNFNPEDGLETYTFGDAEAVAENQVDAAIDAFERVGLLRVLAEPNLTAISGEAAKFLAGGEFPVPAGQDNGQITIEFKPFGVGLAFTPVVLSAGRISLKLATEVSDLTSEGAINTGDTTFVRADGSTSVVRGITVPALQVRRAETTVEMPSGGALVMAGLIQERTRQALEGIPGAKDLPLFGSLFRSRDFLNNETELVIIVTPYIVKPTSPENLRTPADGFANANDFESYFSGRLNAAYRTPSSDTEGRKLAGPLGFILPERRAAAAETDPGSETP